MLRCKHGTFWQFSGAGFAVLWYICFSCYCLVTHTFLLFSFPPLVHFSLWLFLPSWFGDTDAPWLQYSPASHTWLELLWANAILFWIDIKLKRLLWVKMKKVFTSKLSGYGLFFRIILCLDFLFQIKLVNIHATDIADGRPSIVLGLIWTVILYFQVIHHLMRV